MPVRACSRAVVRSFSRCCLPLFNPSRWTRAERHRLAMNDFDPFGEKWRSGSPLYCYPWQVTRFHLPV